MKSKQDTALKLLQKYADSHELLQKENNQLRHMLDDYQKNLKINKDIISNLINETRIIEEIDISSTFNTSKINSQNISHSQINKVSTNNKEIFINVLTNLQEENQNLNKMITENFQITEELRRRLFVSESVAIERTSDITKQNDLLKNKIFLLESAIMKKESQIHNYKEKYESIADSYDRKGYVEREIICIEPTPSIMAIQDELVIYKSFYENLTNYCNSLKQSLSSLERANIRIMDENSNLKLYIREKTRQNYAQNMILQNEITRRSNNFKDKDSAKPNFKPLIEQIKENYSNPYENYNTELNDNGKNCLDTLSKRHRGKSVNKADKETSNNKINYSVYSANLPESNNILCKVKTVYSDDWCDAIKTAGISLSEIDQLKESKKNDLYQRIAEGFELLNQVICDKNVHIDLLIAENEKLNTEIMSNMNEIDSLKKKIVDFNKQNHDTVSMNTHTEKKEQNDSKEIRKEVKKEKTTLKPSNSSNNMKTDNKKIKLEDKFNDFKNQFKNKLIQKQKEKELIKEKTKVKKATDNPFEFNLSIETIKSNDFNINNDCNLESIQEIYNLKNIMNIKK